MKGHHKQAAERLSSKWADLTSLDDSAERGLPTTLKHRPPGPCYGVDKAWMLCISDLKLVESALTDCRLCAGLQDKKEEEGKFPSTLIPQGRWFPEPTLSVPSPGPGQKAPLPCAL